MSKPSKKGSASTAAADMISIGESWLSYAIKEKLIEPIKGIEDQDWYKGLNDKWKIYLRRNHAGEKAPDGETWAVSYRWGTMVIAYKKSKFQNYKLAPIEGGSQWLILLGRLLVLFPNTWEHHATQQIWIHKIVARVRCVKGNLLVNENMDVHGFQVLPSQVESVNSLFEKHPDFASEFRPENSHLRTAYLNSLLTLTEILCHFPEKLTIDDFANAYCTLSCLTKEGFRLDWSEKNLKEIGETRIQANLRKHGCSAGVLTMMLFCSRMLRAFWVYLIS